MRTGFRIPRLGAVWSAAAVHAIEWARASRTFLATWDARRAIAAACVSFRAVADVLHRALHDAFRADTDFPARKDTAIPEARASLAPSFVEANMRAGRLLIGWMSRGAVRTLEATEARAVAAAAQRIDAERAAMGDRLREMEMLRDAIRRVAVS